ncbi:hypothetical protein LXL04_022908 [Taraxacum kok-saghyz]
MRLNISTPIQNPPNATSSPRSSHQDHCHHSQHPRTPPSPLITDNLLSSTTQALIGPPHHRRILRLSLTIRWCISVFKAQMSTMNNKTACDNVSGMIEFSCFFADYKTIFGVLTCLIYVFDDCLKLNYTYLREYDMKVNSLCTVNHLLNMHYFVGTDTSCISWGYCRSGELGYGPTQQKSSANPKKVDDLEGMHVISVACGAGHSMVVVDRTNVEKRLDKFDVYDGNETSEVTEEPATTKKPNKKAAVKTPEKSSKRKKPKAEIEEEDGNESDEAENGHGGQKKHKGVNGKTSGKGRPSAAKKGGAAPAKKGKGGGRAKKSCFILNIVVTVLV